MSIILLRQMIIVIGIVIISGCGVNAKRYVQVRDRVDQEMEGNFGTVFGTPQPEDRSEIRKTRKIYVLELSQDPQEIQEGLVMPETTKEINVTADTQREEDYSPLSPPIPVIDDIDRSSPQSTSGSVFLEYTIQKDDTLQKISKKFYDGFSKWPRIFEANKDKIENPNRLKPGTVIRIPMD